jgi:hypothetical protein
MNHKCGKAPRFTRGFSCHRLQMKYVVQELPALNFIISCCTQLAEVCQKTKLLGVDIKLYETYNYSPE